MTAWRWITFWTLDPILERLAGKYLVNEVSVGVFEIGLARSDVTVVCRTKVEMDVALDTRAGRVLIRELETYVVDAPMAVLFVGDDVLQKLGITPQHLLEQKVASAEVKDVASPYPEDSNLNETFNEDDDELPIGATNDHELLEALQNMVLMASKGLSEMQGKAFLWHFGHFLPL